MVSLEDTSAVKNLLDNHGELIAKFMMLKMNFSCFLPPNILLFNLGMVKFQTKKN